MKRPPFSRRMSRQKASDCQSKHFPGSLPSCRIQELWRFQLFWPAGLPTSPNSPRKTGFRQSVTAPLRQSARASNRSKSPPQYTSCPRLGGTGQGGAAGAGSAAYWVRTGPPARRGAPAGGSVRARPRAAGRSTSPSVRLVRAVEHQAKSAFLGLIAAEQHHAALKIGVAQKGLRDEKRTGFHRRLLQEG